MSDLHVGGNVEAYCGSCKAVRWHIVVALVGEKPVKVECESCHKQHGFRAQAASSSVRTPRTTGASVRKRSAAAAPAEPVFDMAKVSARAHEARAYTPSLTFKVGDVLRHPTFGLGLVQSVPAAQKIDVRFPAGSKLLVHAKS